VVVPTLGVEAFGLVAAEAMAHGTPVIVRDVGALGEIVRDSGGGLAFTGQPGLLGAVERLLTEPGLRERLGEAGHRAHQARWTQAAYLERYLDLVAALGEGRVPAGVGS
jgi:glycosyltransferase involved in cell wall biosynthesis